MRPIFRLSVIAELTAVFISLNVSAALAESSKTMTLEEQITEGEAIFHTYCSPCHGRDARGDGPVAGDLKTVPPSLRDIAKRRGGVFDTQAVVAYVDGRNMPRAHGTPEMPIWGNLFSYIAEVTDALTSDQEAIEHKAQERISLLVKYLESIQEK